MDSIKLLRSASLLEHGYLQHADAEYLEHHNIMYHMYLVSKGLPLNDSIAFA